MVAAFPLQHFFTIDAVSFMISAGAIAILGAHINWHSLKEESEQKKKQHTLPDMLHEFAEGFVAVKDHRPLFFSLLTTILIGGLWGCAFTVGVPLLVKNSFCAGVGDYGFLVGAYGFGNVLGNVVIANLQIRHKLITLFAADVVLGLGFTLLALSHSVSLAMLGCGVAAMGGAVGDLMLLNLILTELPAKHLGKAVSLRLTTMYAGYSVGLIAAAPIYAIFMPAAVIGVCAALMALCGIVGLALFGRTKGAIGAEAT